MSVAELKQNLYNKIKDIDDQNRLEHIWSMVDSPFVDKLSEKEIVILEKLDEQYLKGEEKEVPIDEFNEQLRKKYGL